MPIQPISFPMLSFEQANPGLTRLKMDLGNLLSGMKGVAQTKQSQAMSQNLLNEAALRQKQTNWYDRDIGSQIAERNALTKSHMLDIAKQQMMNNFLSGYLNGGQGNMMGQSGGVSSPTQLGPAMGSASGSQQMMGSSQMPSYSNNVPSPSAYGINIPQIDKQDIALKMFGISSGKEDQIKEAVKLQAAEKQKFDNEIQQGAQTAQSSAQTQDILGRFDDLYKQSSLTGPILGHSPALSDIAKQLDTISTQVLPTQVKNLKSAMGSARFSNVDMGVARNMNINRTLDPESEKLLGNLLKGSSSRFAELPAFYKKISNANVNKNVADLLWSAYNNEFPVSKGKENLNKSIFFMTPRAIDEINRNGTYKPPKNKNGDYYMITPQNKNVAVPVKDIDIALQNGLRPL